MDAHKSGFVNIIGRPNVGKSTLMNALLGERMSIITNKPQTTRHRIIGLLSADDYQIVFSDTPGMIDDPNYKMQEAMNRFVYSSFEDADIMLFVTQPGEIYAEDHPLLSKLRGVTVPLILLLNKMDLASEEELVALESWWTARVPFTEVIRISALHKKNTPNLVSLLLSYLPEGPAYYPKDQLSDRPERFFISEIIREKILEQYHQEIPYSTEVAIESFREDQTRAGEPLTRISAIIYVMRTSQKAIMLGKGGSAIKALGTEARKAIETFLDGKVFLELHIKVREKWRDDEQWLRRFGY
jgi:GTP-binding protein Era